MGRPFPRSAFRRLALSLAMTVAGTLPVIDAAAACASNHGRPFLTGFAGGETAGSSFYAVAENAGPATVTVGVSPGHCDSQPGTTATYATEDRTADTGDYSATAGTSARLCDDVDTPSYCNPGGENLTDTVTVPISNPGSGTDAAVESLLFRLTGADPFPPREPSSAPIHIVDDDGTPRASLEPTLDGTAPVAYERLEFGSVLIPVFRAGTGSSGNVAFSVQPDPSAPAQPGVDYHVVTQSPLSFGTNRVGFIQIDMIGDRIGEGDESLIVTLSGGSLQVAPTMATTTFTIVDNEESLVPESRFHHPRQGLKYKRDDFRIREIHIFAEDEGGSGVVAAQLAIRRNLKNGACTWLTKKGWQRDDCGDRRWLPARFEKVADLFYYRMDPMKPSMGRGRIESYTAFSRAIDGAENVERDFDERRNANTFEIKRKKRRS